MFWNRQAREGPAGLVDVAFTDRHGGVSAPPFDSLDLGGAAVGLDANLDLVAAAFEVDGLALMSQVHGADVCVIGSSTKARPTCDAMVTDAYGVALCVRVADCVPVVLADVVAGVVGVAHAGRAGVVADLVGATVASMRAIGAGEIHAWVGPYVCGGCYEVPPSMRREVADVVPSAFACTTWGTASLDLGAAVVSQLVRHGCSVDDVSACTRETPDLYSFRRDGANAGRSGGLVVLREPT